MLRGETVRGMGRKRLRRGWCFGDREFRKELLEQMTAKLGAEHYGEERTETARAKAERIVREELKRRRWPEETLAARRKGDAGKIQIAGRLRQETTMTVAWIAQRLRMGTRTHLAHLLHWHSRQ